ncbi:MAG: dockerin type I domain-containing protein [Roseburia sp.]|nr:dockerin type I domain-containing protein [Roseburia sp.]
MTTTKKRIAVLIFSALFALAGLGAIIAPLVKIDSVALSGSGTEASPYLISSVSDLKSFRDSVNSGTSYEGKFVKLSSSIDLKYATFTPIGSTSAKPFKGTFDGDNHTISGLYVANTNATESNNSLGLFGNVSGATVKNLIIEKGNVYAGSLAGAAGATGAKNAAGGAGGDAVSVISGGVVGHALNSTVYNCQYTGFVYAVGGDGGAGGVGGTSTGAGKTGGAGGNGADAMVGGIVGAAEGTVVEHCSFVGDIYAYAGKGGAGGQGSTGYQSGNRGGHGGAGGAGGTVTAGGVVGWLYNDFENNAITGAKVSDSYANIDMRLMPGDGGLGYSGRGGNGTGNGGNGGKGGQRGYMWSGGVVGDASGDIDNCFAVGKVEIDGSVKGLPGNGAYGNSKASGTNGIESIGDPELCFGGVAGWAGGDITVSNVYADVSMTEHHYTPYYFKKFNTRLAGIVGLVDCAATIDNAVSLSTHYEAAAGFEGNVFSPIATFTSEETQQATEGNSGNLRWVGNATYLNQNNSDWLPMNFSNMGARASEISAAESLTFGSVFKDFSQSVWEINLSANGGRPVIKDLPFKEHESDTVTVATRDELMAIISELNSGVPYHDLTIDVQGDIELGEWTPFGLSLNKMPATLTINGNNHVFRNMEIAKTTDYKGFMGRALSLNVNDFTIEDPYITGDGGNYVGGVVGSVEWNGRFNNVHVERSSKPTAQNTIIRGRAFMGGIVGSIKGFNHNGLIQDSSATVDIHILTTKGGTITLYSGGLAGGVYGTDVIRCYTAGAVTSDVYATLTYYTGALLGGLFEQSNVNSCFATGNITAGIEGSFIGNVDMSSRGSRVENCYYTGAIKNNSTKAIASGSAMRFGGLISRISAPEVVVANNASFYKSYTKSSKDSSTHRRQGTLYSTVDPYRYNGVNDAGALNTLNPKPLGTSTVFLLNSTVTTNNYFALNTANASCSSHYYGKCSSYANTKTAGVAELFAYHATTQTAETKRAFWYDKIGWDFENTWVWNEELELPVLKTNDYNFPGVGGESIEIANAEELSAFRDYVNAGNNYTGQSIKLVADIDLSSVANWVPIGINATTYFGGTFDGDGHTISNMKINKNSANKGLFACAINAVIKNLTVKNPVITSTAYNTTGGIVGWIQNAEIINCHLVGGSIQSGKSYTGGIVGYINLANAAHYATIDGCSSTFDPAADGNTNVVSEIKGLSYVGGIVGYAANTKAANTITITNCYSTRNILSTAGYSGGIVGCGVGANISKCYSTGAVTVDGAAYAGGIVGYVLTYAAKISDCFSTGDIFSYTASGSAYAGGIAGRIHIKGCTVSNCYALGNISSVTTKASTHAMAGGISGLANAANPAGTFTGCAVLSEKIFASNMAVVDAGGQYVRYTSYIVSGYGANNPTASGGANFYNVDCQISPSSTYSSYTNNNRNAISSQGKTLSAFKDSSTFQSSTLGLGWDFDTVWEWQDGVNNNFPYLKALGAPKYDLGSRYNPVLIGTKDEFAQIADNVASAINYNGVYLKQTADIDIAGVPMIGSAIAKSFGGTYDGDDNKLTGVNLTAAASNVGVFAYVRNANFRNVNVSKPKVTQTGTANNNVGGLIGYSLCNLTIDRCAVLGGSVTNQGGNIGGLVGNADRGYNMITRSFATAKIDGGKFVGGLVGLFRDGEIHKCYSRANVTATMTNSYGAGGIVGVAEYRTRIYDCYAIGNISDTSAAAWSLAGGIVGVFHQTNNAIYRCYFNGTVSAKGGKATGTYTTAHSAGILAYTAQKTDKIIDCISLATEYTVSSTATNNYCQSAEIACGGSTTANLPIITEGGLTNYAIAGITTYVKKTAVRRQAENYIDSLEVFTADPSIVMTNWNINALGGTWLHHPDTNKGLPTLAGLPADNSELDEAIDLALTYKAEDWNTQTYGVLMEAVKVAEDNAETMTDVEKRTYISNIYKAIEGLRPETTALKEEYDFIMENMVPYKEWYVNFVTMDSALALAKTVLEEDSNKYKNIDVALAKSTLDMALENIVVNKTKLNEAIIKANNIILAAENDYEAETIEALKTARAAGVAVNNNAEATAKEVCEATGAINDALNNLKIDKTNLENKIKEAYEALGGTVTFVEGKVVLGNDRTLADEKFETTISFNKAFEAAVAAYDDAASTGTTVAQCAYDLSVALNNLTIDKSALSKAYNDAGTKQREQYTATSWAALETALTAANEELLREPAKPNQFVSYSAHVDKVLADLLAALENLAINKEYLKSLIDIAEAEAQQDIYDEDSLTALNSALAVAKNVYDDNDATVDAVNKAAIDLNAAILNLKVNLDFLKEKIKQADLILSENNANKKYYVVSTVDNLTTARNDAQTCVDECSNLSEEDRTNKEYINKVKTATTALVEALDGIKVDVEILKEYISIVTDETRDDYIGKQGYTAESVEAIKAVAASSQQLLDETDNNPANDALLKAIKDFETAFANMKADKTDLTALVKEVSTWTNTKHRQDNDGNWIMDETVDPPVLKVFVVYEQSTWDELQTYLAAATTVVNDPVATVAAVAEAYEGLQKGIYDLKIDTDELHDRIIKAAGILANTKLYTQESRELLQTPYDIAVEMYDIIEDPERKVRPTLDEAQLVLDNLVYAINHIVIDPTTILEMIQKSRDQAVNSVYYSELTYRALVTQTDMVAGLINENICADDVQDFIDIIVNAMNGLVIITDKLDSAIYIAESLNPEYITAETYAAVATALAEAHDLLDSGKLTVVDYTDKFAAVEEYKEVLAKLEDAIDDIAPDVAKYDAFIASKEPLLQGSYSDVSLDALANAIQAAKDAKTSTEEAFSYYVAIENVEAILEAEQGLVPNTEALEQKIDEITEFLNAEQVKNIYDDEGNVTGENPAYIGKDMVTYEYFTMETYQALQAELTSAKQYVDHPENYTPEQIDSAYDSLVAVYEGLVLDKQLLLDYIAECEALNKSYYEAKTYAALETQIASAKSFCQGTNNVIVDYVAEYKALVAARDGLKFDDSTLTALIERAKEILAAAGKDDGEEGKRYFTEGSIEDLTQAWDDANAHQANPDGYVDEDGNIDEVAKAEAYTSLCTLLYNAIEGMVDIGELKDKIALAKTYDNADGQYSAASYQALQTAVADAEKIYDGANSTRKQVTDAVEAIDRALLGLSLDVADLQTVLNEAKALVAQSDANQRFFTQPTLDALKAEIAVAETFLQETETSGSMDKDRLEQIKNDLIAALYDDLIELTELVEKINSANQFLADNPNDEGKWTALSYQALIDTINGAVVVKDNADATKEEIAEQIAKLSDISSILTLTGAVTGGKAFTLIESNAIYKFVDENGQEVEIHSVDNPAFLVNLALNDTVADVLSQFTNTSVRVFKSDGETEIAEADFATTKVATGMVMFAYDGDTVIDQLTLVVKCDITGDGKVNAVDKAQINAYFLGNKTLEGASKLACDITGDGKINAIDKAQINAYFLGNKNIYDGLSVKENT